MFKKVINFLLIFSIVISLSTLCFATDENSVSNEAVTNSTETSTEGTNETPNQGDEQYIPNDYYQAGSTITIDENTIIDGNAYIAAETVIIKGRIVGDLFVVANNVSIEGAYIYNNVFVCANNFTLKDQGVIYQLYALCNTINIGADGIVYRDLKANASKITINGSVGRDADISAGELAIVLNDTGKNIYNNLNYTTDTEIQIPEGAVAGEVTYNAISEISTKDKILGYVFDLVNILVFASIAFLILVFLTPKFVKNSYALLTTSLGKTTGVGAIILVCVPIVCFILLFSYIGVPVSFALMAIYVLTLLIGTSLMSVCIANFIMNKIKKDKKFILYLLTLAVATVIFLLKLIPYLGLLVSLVIALYTLGLIITNLLPKKEKLKEISKEE